jgi:hypothetical protein
MPTLRPRFKRPYGTRGLVRLSLPSDKSLGYSQVPLRGKYAAIDLDSRFAVLFVARNTTSASRNGTEAVPYRAGPQ